MYGCGEQEVCVACGSGWNLWVWLLGVYRFLILLIPTPLVSVLFYSSIPTFCSFLKIFFVLLEERIRRMPNRDFFTSRGAYVNLSYIAMLYTYSIGNQP